MPQNYNKIHTQSELQIHTGTFPECHAWRKPKMVEGLTLIIHDSIKVLSLP